MSCSLYKESLLRAIQKRQNFVGKKLNSLEIKYEENFEHAEQFIMISKWLESSVDIMKWCSECSSNLSANTIKTLAHKISIGLNLNCIGIIRQIIIFAESFHNPKLSVQLNRKTLTLVLSILVWIVLMCTPIELLHFTYNLYNLSNNKVLSFSEFEELLTDLFLIDQIPENYQPNSQAYQGNKEIQVNEICEDFVEYLQQFNNNNNNNNNSCNIKNNEMEEFLSCDLTECIPFPLFYKFFAVKKRGYLYKFTSLQIQLTEAIQSTKIHAQLFPAGLPAISTPPLFANGAEAAPTLTQLVNHYSEELRYYLALKHGDRNKPPPSSSPLLDVAISPFWQHAQRFLSQIFYDSPMSSSPTSVIVCESHPSSPLSSQDIRSYSGKRAVISSASSVPSSFHNMEIAPPPPPPVPVRSHQYHPTAIPIAIAGSKSRRTSNLLSTDNSWMNLSNGNDSLAVPLITMTAPPTNAYRPAISGFPLLSAPPSTSTATANKASSTICGIRISSINSNGTGTMEPHSHFSICPEFSSISNNNYISDMIKQSPNSSTRNKQKKSSNSQQQPQQPLSLMATGTTDKQHQSALPAVTTLTALPGHSKALPATTESAAAQRLIPFSGSSSSSSTGTTAKPPTSKSTADSNNISPP